MLLRDRAEAISDLKPVTPAASPAGGIFGTLSATKIVKALFAVVLVQLAYWTLINPYLFNPWPTPDALPVGNAAVAKLKAPDLAALGKAEFKPVQLPWSDCCESGYRAVRMQFSLAAIPEGGLGLVSHLDADNYRLHVNGSLFIGDGEMILPFISYHGVNRATYRIPPKLLKVGTNRLDYIMVRDAGIPRFAMRMPTIGEFETIKKAYSWRNFSFTSLRAMSQAIGFAAAMLAFVLWARSERNPAIFWMAVVCLAWALRLQFHRLTYGFFQGELRIILLYVYVSVLPVALLNFANHWTGHPNRQLGRLSLAGLALVLAAVSSILWFGLLGKVKTAEQVSMAFGLIAALATIGLFIVHYARRHEHRHWEAATFAMCATLIAHDSLTSLLGLPDGEHVQRALPVLLLGFLAPFFAGNVRLFRSMSEFNQLLQTELDERTAELEAAHHREKELVRAQAHLSERQRIMRDMHDGLGSQLMSMLLAARRGVAEPATVAEGLQSVIDEMRLLIDSMDSAGESLASGFALFRDRMKGRVEGAGMAFEWRDDTQDKLPDLGPRDVLQVFRILQEAATNALKHAGGTRLSIVLSPAPAPGHALRIAISDNGAGIRQTNPRGKGMDSMAARAVGIGGTLDVQSSADGVTVNLDLPDS